MPKSVTESSMDHGHPKDKQMHFDRSEKDESFDQPPGLRLHEQQMEVMGVSIDSQSMDLSLMKSKPRRAKKLKEDLDGSRVYRDHEEEQKQTFESKT